MSSNNLEKIENQSIDQTSENQNELNRVNSTETDFTKEINPIEETTEPQLSSSDQNIVAESPRSVKEPEVKISLSTKLMAGVVTILVLTILFINISTLLILKDDKRSSVYQVQHVKALLMGRDLQHGISESIEKSRKALSYLYMNENLTSIQRNEVQSTFSHLSPVVALQLGFWDAQAKSFTVVDSFFQKEKFKDFGLSSDSFTSQVNLSLQKALLTVESDLMHGQVAFLGNRAVSLVQGKAILPVVFADVVDKAQSTERTRFSIGISYVYLDSFKDLLNRIEEKEDSFHLVSSKGTILFGSDLELSNEPIFQLANSSGANNGVKEYSVTDLNESSIKQRFLGTFFKPGFGLTLLIRTPWQKAMQSAYVLIGKFILLGIMSICLCVIFAILFSKTMTAPIRKVFEATKEISKGNFNIQIKSRSKDEIGALTTSFVSMSHQIQHLIDEQTKKAHLESEIEITSTVQRTLIPASVVEESDFTIHSFYEPASHCGGDLWCYFKVNRKLCIVIADATGHGLPSALITATARGSVSFLQKLAEKHQDITYSPHTILSYINRAIYDCSQGKIMMTMFAAIVDLEKKSITYANAGHNPPFVVAVKSQSDENINNEGNVTIRSLSTPPATRLGDFYDYPETKQYAVALTPGDVIFFYTDGILESTDVHGQSFGKKKLKDSIEQALKIPQNSIPTQSITSSVTDRFKQHVGEKPLDDDVTVVALQIK